MFVMNLMANKSCSVHFTVSLSMSKAALMIINSLESKHFLKLNPMKSPYFIVNNNNTSFEQTF